MNFGLVYKPLQNVFLSLPIPFILFCCYKIIRFSLVLVLGRFQTITAELFHRKGQVLFTEVDLCIQPFLNLPVTRLVRRLCQLILECYYNALRSCPITKTTVYIEIIVYCMCILRTEMFPGLQE